MTIAIIHKLRTKVPKTLCCLEIISFNEGRNRWKGQFSIEALKFCKEVWGLNLPFPSSTGASAPGSGTFLQSSEMTCCFWGSSLLRRRWAGAAVAENYSALVGPCYHSGSQGVWAQLWDVNSDNWSKLFQKQNCPYSPRYRKERPFALTKTSLSTITWTNWTLSWEVHSVESSECFSTNMREMNEQLVYRLSRWRVATLLSHKEKLSNLQF